MTESLKPARTKRSEDPFAKPRLPTYRLHREFERRVGDWELGAKDHSDSPSHRYRSVRFGRVHLNENGSNSIGWLYLHASRVWYGEDKYEFDHTNVSFSVSFYVGPFNFHYNGEWRSPRRRKQ